VDRGDLSLHVLRNRAELEPDRPWVAELGGDRLTYAASHRLATAWAAAFEELGVRPGDTVASMLPNCVAALHGWIGAGWLGAVHIPINTELIGRPLSAALNLTKARVLVASAGVLDAITRVHDDLPCLELVVVVDGASADAADRRLTAIDGDELVATVTRREYPGPDVEDCSGGMFTSGTTGSPKCALLTWGALEAAGRWLLPSSDPATSSGGAYYNPWPAFHNLSAAGLAVALQRDLRLVLRRGFSVGAFWSDIEEYECTHTVLLVTTPLLLDAPAREEDAKNSLEHVTIVPVTARTAEFAARFGVRVGSVFGLTETGPVFVSDDIASHLGAGRPVPGYALRIVPAQGSTTVTEGELVVRPDESWRLARGYLGSPAGDEDGWFATGDLCRVDDGWYSFTDRLKDSIRRRGHNISSVEVENEVLTHPDVERCACVAVPSDDAFGEDEVQIFVVRRDGSAVTEATLHRHLAALLPAFMVPRFIEFIADLPVTPTRKVRKDLLRKIGASGSPWDGARHAPL
jgi:crotonobetaine/carnitine-CoA ligase